ncbi:hypothetical protein GCM10028856_35420 [Halopiger thermotolerans]
MNDSNIVRSEIESILKDSVKENGLVMNSGNDEDILEDIPDIRANSTDTNEKYPPVAINTIFVIRSILSNATLDHRYALIVT